MATVLPTGPISNRQPFQVRTGPGMHSATFTYGKDSKGRAIVPVPILLSDREKNGKTLLLLMLAAVALRVAAADATVRAALV